MKAISVDIYDIRVLTFTSNKAFEKYLIKHGSNHDDMKEYMQNSKGLAGVLQYAQPLMVDGEELYSDLFLVVDVKDPSVVVHECVHCALMILDHVGITASPEEQEPLCYLTEYLYKQFFKLHPNF